MLFRIVREFSVDPPAPGQGQIVERLKERLASTLPIVAVSAVPELSDQGLERIRVDMIVDADSMATAGDIVRRCIRRALQAVGVPPEHLRLIGGAGGQVRDG